MSNDFKAVLGIRIRDPVLFDPWIRDPGWVESQHPDPGSGMNNPNHIFYLEIIFLGVKIVKFFDADPGSGMEKSRIRDKDPGFATLF